MTCVYSANTYAQKEIILLYYFHWQACRNLVDRLGVNKIGVFAAVLTRIFLIFHRWGHLIVCIIIMHAIEGCTYFDWT